ncbi:unnamed protein product, partial [Musa acuminata subsp. burmannicoides]
SFAGEKKLAKVIVPDKWKEGASNTTESGGRKINENKLLSKKNRYILDSSRIGTRETPSPFDARGVLNTCIHFLLQGCVPCAGSKCWIQSYTSKVTVL